MSTMTPILDCHAHVVPERLLAEVSHHDDADGVRARKVDAGWMVELPGAGERLVRERMYRSEHRLSYLSRQGVDAQLVAPWLDIQPTPAMSSGNARSWARRVNEALLQDTLGSSVGTLASIALDDTELSARDLDDAVRRAGMSGLVLSTDPAHCIHLGDPRLEPVWSVAEELGVPVLLHPLSDGPSRALPDSQEFGNAYCRLVDTSFAVARLILAGTLDRHPDLRLITVHGGGFLPFQSGRLDGAHRADKLAPYHLERATPSAYLSDLYFDTVAMSTEAIRFLVDLVGANRVLLGTDYPFPLGDPRPVETIRAVGLPDEATAAILGGNLRNLLSRSHHV